MSSIIHTEGLSKDFRHPLFPWRIRARAVRDLSLDVREGEVFALLGPNGSGKSTTIKLVLGLLRPTAGHARVFGEAPQSLRVKRRIGYLPEESWLYPFLTPDEVLDYFGRLFGLPRAERRRRIDALVDLVGLSRQRRRAIGEFSKGMQRRVALAQCLINAPDLVILDEPTSGLDAIGIAEVKDLIRRLRALGKTIVLSSHRMADVEDVSDRIAILYGGRARVLGSLRELVEAHDLRQITASLDDEALRAVLDLIRARIGANHEVTVAPARERLESYFLRVIRDARAAQAETSGAEGAKDSGLEFLGTPKPKSG